MTCFIAYDTNAVTDKESDKQREKQKQRQTKTKTNEDRDRDRQTVAALPSAWFMAVSPSTIFTPVV